MHSTKRLQIKKNTQDAAMSTAQNLLHRLGFEITNISFPEEALHLKSTNLDHLSQDFAQCFRDRPEFFDMEGIVIDLMPAEPRHRAKYGGFGRTNGLRSPSGDPAQPPAGHCGGMRRQCLADCRAVAIWLCPHARTAAPSKRGIPAGEGGTKPSVAPGRISNPADGCAGDRQGAAVVSRCVPAGVARS